MHFIPQVVIAGIAWGAGFQQPHAAQQASSVPHNTAPEAIQQAYNVLRKHIRDDRKYDEAEKWVKQIEEGLDKLNAALWDPLPPEPQPEEPPADIKAALALLQKLDQETMSWRENITAY